MTDKKMTRDVTDHMIVEAVHKGLLLGNLALTTAVMTGPTNGPAEPRTVVTATAPWADIEKTIGPPVPSQKPRRHYPLYGSTLSNFVASCSVLIDKACSPACGRPSRLHDSHALALSR